MRNLLPSLLFFLLLCAAPAHAQERLVSGVMTGEDGAPLPGVSIVVKGTANGTTSDANGRYSLRAPLGATLVVSFIGYATYEVVVTESNSSPVGGGGRNAVPGTPRKLYAAGQVQDTLVNRRGVASLTDSSPRYVRQGGDNQAPQTLGKQIPFVASITYRKGLLTGIWYGQKARNGLFIIKDNYAPARPFRVTFCSSFTLDQVNRLPERQNQFAQGRPQGGEAVWRGPETGEIFSWGPALGELQYTGRPYPSDRNGPLTPTASGNGMPAKAYAPEAFFRVGTTLDNALTINKQQGNTYFSLGASRKDQQYVIPGSDLHRDNLNARLSTTLFGRLGLDYSLALSRAEGDLLGRGANLTNILASVYRTPPSFDNAGGLSPRQAATRPQAYQQPDGTGRSHSPGNADNPYFLINQLPDRQQIDLLVSSLALKYQLHDFRFGYTVGIERQRQHDQFGLPVTAVGYPAGRLTKRQEVAKVFRSGFSSSYRRWLSRSYFEAGLLYDFNYGQRQLGRQNGFGFAGNEPFAMAFADSVGAVNAFRTRQVHELRANAGFNYRDVLYLNAYNRGYLSSTLGQSALFLPGAGASFTFTNLYPFTDQSVLTSGKLRSSYAHTVQEAPLLYNNWHYASTRLPIARYQSYYESPELPFAPGLDAERHRKFEAGAEMQFFGRLTLEFNYFRQLTQAALFPVTTENGFRLVNGADIVNRGIDGSLNYRHYAYDSGITWDITLSWGHFNPVVERLYDGRERIPLAGFAEVSTNLVAGRPVGVIYGATYQRNGNGERMIGPDGFPLANPQLQPIGNPNPDWTAGFSNSVSWKSLACSFVVDVRKGGHIWNGTGQALDYYGVSRRTGEERLVQHYLFSGVKPDGSPNDVSVRFADPAAGVEANRWVRYGLAGVAEEAITDGSWVRLQEVKFTYNCSRLLRSLLPAGDVRLSFIGKNLLLLSRYPGVDPSAGLFGYNWGAGLDFFNAPSTRSYGVSLRVHL